MDYTRRLCQGLCQQIDSLKVCVGLCATDVHWVQATYDRHKAHAIKHGLPWTEIAYFEDRRGVAPSAAPEDAKPITVQPASVSMRR